MEFYRLVDTNGEPENTVIDTNTAQISPRMMRSVSLAPLFNLLLPFWAESGVQIDTACNCMLNMQDYLSEVQDIEKKGLTEVPTHLLNSKEKKQNISLEMLKTIMFPYYDYYNETGASLEIEDLPYIWEYLWEVVRKSFFPSKTSRFNSIFLFDNKTTAKTFQKEKMFLREALCSVEIIETYNMQRYDMNWLDQVPTDCTYSEMHQYAANYWSGKLTDTPTIEYLFSGKYRLHRVSENTDEDVDFVAC